jgi:hypothetical protein
MHTTGSPEQLGRSWINLVPRQFLALTRKNLLSRSVAPALPATRASCTATVVVRACTAAEYSKQYHRHHPAQVVSLLTYVMHDIHWFCTCMASGSASVPGHVIPHAALCTICTQAMLLHGRKASPASMTTAVQCTTCSQQPPVCAASAHRARDWQLNLSNLAQAVLFVLLIWIVDRAVSFSNQQSAYLRAERDPAPVPVGSLTPCAQDTFLQVGCCHCLYMPKHAEA